MPRVGLRALLAIPGHSRPITAHNQVCGRENQADSTCFGLQGLEVKDGDSGGLAAGACSRRNWAQKPTKLKGS